jgi:glutathione peroxidase
MCICACCRLQDIDGRNKSLGAFKGKVLLVTNVASECGFTPQVLCLPYPKRF